MSRNIFLNLGVPVFSESISASALRVRSRTYGGCTTGRGCSQRSVGSIIGETVHLLQQQLLVCDHIVQARPLLLYW